MIFKYFPGLGLHSLGAINQEILLHCRHQARWSGHGQEVRLDLSLAMYVSHTTERRATVGRGDNDGV